MQLAQIHRLADELRSIITSKNPDVNVAVCDAQIVLDGKSFGKMLTIICDDDLELFRIKESMLYRGVQTQVHPDMAHPPAPLINRREMRAKVERWLNKHQPRSSC
jgi:hypothetical protein